MQEYAIALALAALPAIGNLIGGMLAETFRISNRKKKSEL
jgi:hypothetical protein